MSSLPWVMHQRWTSLLFAHWPVRAELLRPLLPPSLTLDTFEGVAWVGVIPFYMSNVRPRGIPPLPGISAFHELNVRTYVRVGARAGVWFFSLDASNPLAVRVARAAVHLPYYDARMHMSVASDGTVGYRSDRTHRGAPAATFEAQYRPDGAVYRAAPGTLDHFLVERYELFSTAPEGLLSVKIAHPPWPLQRATARIARNTMGAAAGIELREEPAHLHFAARVDVRTWLPVSL
ncbi:MAG TPA: DUF2071 domain-containing protein [Gemmatimonadaceae bacterium]|nr:DUF2071 domain-containing protein [Gemmatimonadaceae bacterium]